MFVILALGALGLLVVASKDVLADGSNAPRPRPRPLPGTPPKQPGQGGNWRDLATTSQYETKGALEQFPGYSMLDEYEREIIDYVNEQVDTGASLTEDALKTGAIALFGPAAAPVLDRLFETDWWKSKKQWIKDKFGDAVGEVKDAGEDALEWADENLNPFRMGEIPQAAMTRFAMQQIRGLEEFIPLCMAKLGHYVGSTVVVDGIHHPVTASGLCALAQRAGMRGAESWLNAPSDHSRYPASTQAFLDNNGIF